MAGRQSHEYARQPGIRGLALDAVKNLVDDQRIGHAPTVAKARRQVNLRWSGRNKSVVAVSNNIDTMRGEVNFKGSAAQQGDAVVALDSRSRTDY